MGIGVLPWSPLARGILARPPAEKSSTRAKSDDFSKHLYGDDTQEEILNAVGTVAERHGVSRAQIALAWLLHQPGVTAPIIGATKLDHLHDAVAATDVELDQDDLDLLTGPYLPRPTLGHDE
jgi:aryl-alcohol dehydrogenase (NADP+)